MAIYNYPDGGEHDPRIETPDLPQPEPAPAAAPVPQSPSAADNPLQQLIQEAMVALLRARAIWSIDRGATELPTAGPLVDDAIEELAALARLYRCNVQPETLPIGQERAAEALITVAETINRLAQQPMPLSLATWFGNVSLQLMVVLGR